MLGSGARACTTWWRKVDFLVSFNAGKVPSLNMSVAAGVMLCEIVRQRRKAQRMQVKALRVLCVLCGLLVQAYAMDREAFTFTNYNLDVRIEPQQRLAVRGKITLRNDSASPQKIFAFRFPPPWTGDRSSLTANRLSSLPSPTPRTSTTPVRFPEALVTLPKDVPPRARWNWKSEYRASSPLMRPG